MVQAGERYFGQPDLLQSPRGVDAHDLHHPLRRLAHHGAGVAGNVLHDPLDLVKNAAEGPAAARRHRQGPLQVAPKFARGVRIEADGLRAPRAGAPPVSIGIPRPHLPIDHPQVAPVATRLHTPPEIPWPQFGRIAQLMPKLPQPAQSPPRMPPLRAPFQRLQRERVLIDYEPVRRTSREGGHRLLLPGQVRQVLPHCVERVGASSRRYSGTRQAVPFTASSWACGGCPGPLPAACVGQGPPGCSRRV